MGIMKLIDNYEMVDYRRPLADELYYSNGKVHRASGGMILSFPILKKQDTYWYVDSRGVVLGTMNTNCFIDKERIEIGNYYLTKEEALDASERVRECYG